MLMASPAGRQLHSEAQQQVEGSARRPQQPNGPPNVSPDGSPVATSDGAQQPRPPPAQLLAFRVGDARECRLCASGHQSALEQHQVGTLAAAFSIAQGTCSTQLLLCAPMDLVRVQPHVGTNCANGSSADAEIKQAFTFA